MRRPRSGWTWSQIGQPLCADCYDYTAHALWHAHASKLWDRFVIDVRRRLASSAGLVQSRFAQHARLSFARVAEYQKRAVAYRGGDVLAS
ncbi:replication initiator [Streptomyces hygroscopicus]|uniref:replication initiator n=1 Tax=Streptomyces hygroscopicus TaxID=1912 RepID=UPI003A0FF252